MDFAVSVRGTTGKLKTVQMTEGEIRALCLKSREIFLSQPILLELEAPLKICGELVLFKLLNPFGVLQLILNDIEKNIDKLILILM